MAMLDNLLAFLSERQVAHTHTTHPTAYTAREVANAEHVPEHSVAKVVVFFTQDNYGMAVLPADSVVDLEELRLALGTPRLRLATEHELMELFPRCELGAMPPLGNGTMFEMPVYVDETLTTEPEITFNAGTHRDVVHMAYQDYAKLVRPVVVRFAHHLAGA